MSRSHGARLRAVTLALALLALFVVASSPADAAKVVPVGYVSLGDSYTAGPLIPNQLPDPWGCLRSDHNYPHLVAPTITQPLTDVSCSGAKTDDMTQPQDVELGPNPPQLGALKPDTAIVTLGIGGNDIGFSSIAQDCASPTPTGHPCQDKYVVDGHDQLADRIAQTGPKVATVIRQIRTASPRARVFVVGYPSILPQSGPGCWPVMPIAPDDVPYLRSVQTNLNAMLAQQARAAGVRYVDVFTPSIGHDACQLPGDKWVEPPAPTAPAAPVHPNAVGMQGMAAVVTTVINTR